MVKWEPEKGVFFIKYLTSVPDCVYTLQNDCATDHMYISAPQGMSRPHHHDDYEIYFLLSGSRKYFVNNTITTLCPNQIVIFKPKVPHQVTVNLKIPYERNLIYITPYLFSDIIKENPALKPISEIQRYSLSDKDFHEALGYIRLLDSELETNDAYSHSMIKGILTQLFGFILRHNHSSDITIDKGDIRIQNAIDYILENYPDPITLNDCAEIACMSAANFSKTFHKITAITFQEFLNMIRIDRACEMLTDSHDSIAQIAQAVGFSTESHFSYIFKKRTHNSPSAYRALYRSGKQTE